MERPNEKSKLDNSDQAANPTTATAAIAGSGSTTVTTPPPAPVGWYYTGGMINPANYLAWGLGWKNTASGAGPAQSDVPVQSTTPNKTPAPAPSDVATPKNK